MHQQPLDGAAPALPHALAIRFTGSGSEYFRIWIVNLLLTVLTLTLYLPWAKVRKLKYFHGNTLVGDAPLGFHGNPRKMLRGYLLVGLLFILYTLAGQFSPMAGLVALAIVVAIAPALFRAALQFRLANTSWRGLRLRFTGGLREAYALAIPVVAMVAVGFGLGLFASLQQGGHVAVVLAVLLPILLLQGWAVVWLLWRTKKYQHDHYALASLQTHFSGRLRQFAGLLLRSAGLALLVAALAGGIVAGAAALGPALAPRTRTVLFSLLPLALVLLLFVALKPYFVTRLQNLVWNHTGSDALQFHSALRVRPMLGLTLKNWLLIVVTLGLYWPFAAVAMARLRLQAVSLSTRDDPAQLFDQLRAEHAEAAGDAAGDLFGFDVGL
ncbi:YjgN family protein [Pseudorhodoferax sp.]|uniref:YjgN family protein n=1 Tax=Pseudorhodoferax sp. TaxID=1993553 RepID=UPI002DD6B357|nr:DUF898 family protein [Pseudorhodoferax sp.]